MSEMSAHLARPLRLDLEEPARVADVVAELKFKQVVMTSVTRDDLPDGGASMFARTMELLRRQDDNVRVEFLVSELAAIGKDIGFGHVEAGPLVRSSYRPFNQSRHLLEKAC